VSYPDLSLQEIISIQKINNKSSIDSYDVIIIYFLCQALFLCKICGQFDTLEPLPRCHLSVKKTVKYNTLKNNISKSIEDLLFIF
jgi:hypothetical protein